MKYGFFSARGILSLRYTTAALLVVAGTAGSPAALAFGFSSIAVAEGAVMYDAPSVRAGKLFVAGRYLPVEVIVKVSEWVKVRNYDGSLAWVEEKALSSKRYLVVTALQAGVYQEADSASPLLFEVQQNVVVEWLASANSGWAKVRHHGGQTGYIKTHQVWGS